MFLNSLILETTPYFVIRFCPQNTQPQLKFGYSLFTSDNISLLRSGKSHNEGGMTGSG